MRMSTSQQRRTGKQRRVWSYNALRSAITAQRRPRNRANALSTTGAGERVPHTQRRRRHRLALAAPLPRRPHRLTAALTHSGVFPAFAGGARALGRHVCEKGRSSIASADYVNWHVTPPSAIQWRLLGVGIRQCLGSSCQTSTAKKSRPLSRPACTLLAS